MENREVIRGCVLSRMESAFFHFYLFQVDSDDENKYHKKEDRSVIVSIRECFDAMSPCSNSHMIFPRIIYDIISV